MEEAAGRINLLAGLSEFAADGRAEHTHAALVRETLGEHLIGHISRDGTAIKARKKPARKVKAAREQPAPKKRGRLRKGQVREAAPGKLEQQRGKPLKELPRDCDRGSKSNAQGYQNSWNGYKLHLDTASADQLLRLLT